MIKIEGRTLADALKPIVAVVERRNTIPILSNVRLTMTEAGLRLDGTDLDINVSICVDVIDADKYGLDLTLPAEQLFKIAKAAGAAVLTFKPSARENVVDIASSADAAYVLYSLPANDYPEGTKLEATQSESFTNGMLAQALASVADSISTEETRYYLNGACWQYLAGDKTFTTTDGHRLTSLLYEKAGKDLEDMALILPAKFLRFLMKFAAGKDVTLHHIGKESTRIRAEIGNMIVTAKLVNGTYPDWRRIVPKDAPETIKFNRADLIEVNRTVIVAQERGRAVKFYEQDGKISLTVKNPDLGEAVARTSAECKPGTAFAFNARYVMQTLKQCQGDVTFHYSHAGAPFIIRDEDERMTRVFMPMRA